MDEGEHASKREAIKPADRAAIVAALASMEIITPVDRAKAQKALGLSASRLNQLIRVWKLHGSGAMRMGSAKNDPEVRARAVAAAAGPLDLSEIEPGHRAEVERRIRILGRFLQEDSISRTVSDRYAAEYGVTYGSFRTAATSWLLDPRPASLPGIAWWLRGATRSRRMVDPRAEAAIADAIADLGPDASTMAVERRAAQISRERSVPAASPSAVAIRLLAARSRASGRNGRDAALCLDRVLVRSSDLGGSGPPSTALLLFGPSSGTIVAHRLVPRAPSPREDALLLADHLRRSRGEDAAALEVAWPAGGGWSELSAIISRAGSGLLTVRKRGLRSGRLAFATFGDRVGGIRILRLNAVNSLLFEEDAHVDEAAEAAFSAAVERHNQGRPLPNVAIGAADERWTLAEELIRFAARAPSG